MTRSAEELLPFYVNGTLDAAERAEVDAALADSADLRAELEVLTALRKQMQAEEVESPGEFGLARLMRDVDRDGPASSAPGEEPGNVVPIRRLRIWQIAAALVLAIGLAQSVILLNAPGDPGFELASGGAAGADFVVGFAPDATEAQIRALLLNAGVEISAGPSALGLYELAVLDETGIQAAEEMLLAAEGRLIDTLEVIAP
ncbi:zf-HC2 domain-containing protein [Rhodophyticola porphyridii]|uniref:Zf-HC2 domain-containing protein n=1 Tax=Rhodophyticola porphyridii TaxID=1852017 RepID=A0A3L9XZ80_9RHOB|nr:zf-HC2 domain-containing protein [Rhodophyticola porphyridii]RMA41849.1 zf-HC2 domain-containing protein [Rhodophyticola porphyridii]